MSPSGLPSFPPAHGSLRNTCGSMLRGRSVHSATTLRDGSVLIAGGLANPPVNNTVGNPDGLLPCPAGCDVPIADTERYEPAAGVFVPTTPMLQARARHLAVRLNNGQVLIVGGAGPLGTDPSATAELYDPVLLRFTATGSMAFGRSGGASATLLDDGRVLIVGGYHCEVYWQTSTCDGLAGLTATAELYHPATGRFTATGSMAVRRSGHAAVKLADGKVLIVGGSSFNNASLSSAELYDPETGQFSPAGAMSAARAPVAGARLADGRVLLVGYDDANGFGQSSADLYDPETGQFSALGNLPDQWPRGPDTALRLADGRIFLNPVQCNRPQLYDPVSATFSIAGTNLDVPNDPYLNCDGAAALLSDGEVLLTGGSTWVPIGRDYYITEHFTLSQLFRP